MMINKTNFKHSKSQSAIEFMILIGFVLFFFTSFFIVIQWNMRDKLEERNNAAIQNVALIVQDEINLAYESSDGYSRTFRLPEKIDSREYEINITSDLVYIQTKDKYYATALPVHRVVGDVKLGDNFIKKENGEIILNP